MDFLYKLFPDANSQAIETHRKVIYRKISLCCKDVSVTKSKALFVKKCSLSSANMASVPILRQNAGVALNILNTVQVQLLLLGISNQFSYFPHSRPSNLTRMNSRNSQIMLGISLTGSGGPIEMQRFPRSG